MFVILFLAIFSVTSIYAKDWSNEKSRAEIDRLLKEVNVRVFKSDSVRLVKIKRAEKIAIQLNDEKRLGEVYTMFGICYYSSGAYELSLEMYLKSIPIHEKYKNYKLMSRSLNGLGLLQNGYDQPTEAMETYRKCLKLDLKTNNYDGIARTYYNMAISQMLLEQYDHASLSLRKSLVATKKAKSDEFNLMIESKLGDLMRITNKTDSAIYFYNRILKSSRPVATKKEQIYAHAGIAQTYLIIEDLVNAEKHGLIAFKFAQERKINADIARIAKVNSLIYEKIGNKSRAYDFLKITNGLGEFYIAKINLRILIIH